jgi:hypothetical protein
LLLIAKQKSQIDTGLFLAGFVMYVLAVVEEPVAGQASITILPRALATTSPHDLVSFDMPSSH